MKQLRISDTIYSTNFHFPLDRSKLSEELPFFPCHEIQLVSSCFIFFSHGPMGPPGNLQPGFGVLCRSTMEGHQHIPGFHRAVGFSERLHTPLVHVAGDDEVLPAAETGLDMGRCWAWWWISCFCHWESWELEETYQVMPTRSKTSGNWMNIIG